MNAEPLWTSVEAATAAHGRARGDFTAFGVSIDSRSVNTGDLFVALKGPRFDGHAFAASALKAGASAALVDHVPADVAEDAALIIVDDTLEGLQGLATTARKRSNARIVAVTGSVGKTSTKEMLRLVLARQGETHANPGSLNNHWGVPLSLARLPRAAHFGVFEMGMNHPGEIRPLTQLARPHVAVITTIETVHAEFFSSLEEIADAKAEIFEGMDQSGVAILNRDNPQFHRLRAKAEDCGVARVLTFGAHIDADARLLDCAIDPDASHVLALIGDQPVAYRIGVPGRHWVMNSLAVLLAVSALGGAPDKAALALADMTPPKGRGERHRVPLMGGNFELIDESYNASPVSMRAALATLAAARPAKGARRIAVLGDMLELGAKGPAFHAELASAVTDNGIDLAFCAGALMENLFAALPAERQGGKAPDADALISLVKAALQPGDVVMVKGSAGSRMGRVVQALLAMGA